ncbi:permease [marine bacterium AO1-C]|nr:permease [marine bacterium AO1-C]
MSMLTKRQRALAWVILIALAFVWGSSFILIKKGLVVYQPVQVGALRVISAFVFLVGLVLVRIRKVPRAKWGTLFVSGVAGVLIPAFLFPLAQTRVDSAITGVLNALTPLSALIIGVAVFRQKTTWGKVIGIVVGFIGISILIFTGADGQVNFNAYALFAVGATVCYGFNVNYIKRYLNDLKSIDVSTFSVAFMGPFALVYLFTTDFTTVYAEKEGSGMALIYVAILGIAGTALALIFFNKLLQMTNPIFASSVTYLIPIVAIIWGVLDGEQLVTSHYIGMAVTILGVWLVNRK